MPRVARGLEAVMVKKYPPGRHGDGCGLYLVVREPSEGERASSRYWVFRYRVRGGRSRELGLGSAVNAPVVSLREARAAAVDLMRKVRRGIDPLGERASAAEAAKLAAAAAAAGAVTFDHAAEAYIAAHEAGWRNAKHRAQWTATLEAYAYPHMGDLPAGDVTTAHVMAALEPIWQTKPETASRLRGRIEAVLDYAKARGWRTGENPARWKGHIANMLPMRAKMARVEHHAALPWREISEFVATLRAQPGLGAVAMQFAILTAARSGEVLNATWGEVDLDGATWTIPPPRMKAGRQHRVPLPPPALALLRGLLPLRDADAGDWVFPGPRRGRPLSSMAMAMTLRRMGRNDLTTHGFRSTFRDWAAESTDYPREVAEAALAHTIGDKVEAAYRRGDLFAKRSELMADWAAVCTTPA